jgi:large subunit ribosomal protein L25
VSETTLVAEERTAFGKGAARAVRRAKKVPAVLYGHGQDPRHLSLPGHQLMLALKHGGSNALLTLDLGNGEQQLALPKSVTRDPIKGFLEHVDLIVVRRGEKVTINVPVTTTGEVRSDILLTQPLTELSVEAEATHIPTGFEVAVEGIEPGVTIYARDIELPNGVTLVTDPDAIVLSAQGAQTAEQVEAELAGAEADAGITHDAPQSDSAAETPAE